MRRSRRNVPAHLAEPDDLFRDIQHVLDQDLSRGGGLMLKKYRELIDDSLGGYCTIATEAYFFLHGQGTRDPREGGDLQPMMKPHHDGSHWWLRRTSDGAIIDLTIRPGEPANAADYEDGRPKGFMMHGYRKPSQRALTLMERVRARRGEKPIA